VAFPGAQHAVVRRKVGHVQFVHQFRMLWKHRHGKRCEFLRNMLPCGFKRPVRRLLQQTM